MCDQNEGKTVQESGWGVEHWPSVNTAQGPLSSRQAAPAGNILGENQAWSCSAKGQVHSLWGKMPKVPSAVRATGETSGLCLSTCVADREGVDGD